MSGDMFGQDNITSDGTPSVDPTAAASDAVAATPPSAPLASTAGAAPTVQQAVDKATAKVTADAAVATDPHAVHHVKLAPAAPTVLGSTATGAGIGFLVGGPPGAAVGAGIGWVAERYQIGGGPVGKIWGGIKKRFQHPAVAKAADVKDAKVAAAATQAGTAAAAIHGERQMHTSSQIPMGGTEPLG